MNVEKLSDRIAHDIEQTSSFLNRNWETIILFVWLILITITLLRQKHDLKEASSYNQVANVHMLVDDIRYSVSNTEEDIERMELAITRMDEAIRNLELTSNQILNKMRLNP